MTQTEKALQLIDLCARLPYNTKIAYCTPDNTEVVTLSLATIKIIEAIPVYTDFPISVKPYLRPMSSMTEEEFRNLQEFSGLKYDQLDLAEYQNNYKCLDFYLSEIPSDVVILVFDWLNKHHFDYRCLIERGLALKAPEGMYEI